MTILLDFAIPQQQMEHFIQLIDKQRKCCLYIFQAWVEVTSS